MHLSNTTRLSRASVRHSQGGGGLSTGPVRPKARIGRALSIAALVILVGCSSAQTNGSTAQTSSPSPTPSPSSIPPAPNEVQASRSEVVAAYQQYLDATAQAMETGNGELPELLDVASGQALASAQARVVALASQDRTARGRLVPSIEAVQIEDNSATIRDCYRADITEHDVDTGNQVADRNGARLRATAELEHHADGSWIVTSFSEGDACVPSDLAEDIAARYLVFWDVVGEVGSPPEPDHPGLAEVAAGEQLEGLRARLQDFKDQGYEVRDASIAHPTVVRISQRDTVAHVRDCRELDPEGGVYDATTGELVDGGAQPGQHALWAVRLQLIDGTWKVVDADLAEGDSACAEGS